MSDDLAPARLPSNGVEIPTDRQALLVMLEDLEGIEAQQSATVEHLSEALDAARRRRDLAYDERQTTRLDVRTVRIALRNTMPIHREALGLDEPREDS